MYCGIRFHGLVAQRLSSKQEITSSILVGALIFKPIFQPNPN